MFSSDALAEQSVLGALLLEPQATRRVAHRLRVEHFSDPRHARIYAVALDLDARKSPPDVITVHAELRRRGEAAGDELGYLSGLAQSVPSASRVEHYAELVAGMARRRTVADVAQRLVDAANAGDELDVAVDAAEAALRAVRCGHSRTEPTPLAEAFARRLDDWDAMAAGTKPAGITTGLPRLDDALGGGFKRGATYVIAARPGCGKSSLALQTSLASARTGAAVLIVSQEMPTSEVVDRVAANLGDADIGILVRHGTADDDTARGVLEAHEALLGLKVWIDDRAAQRLSDLRRRVHAMKDRGELDLLVVDYLQLCGADGRAEHRHHQIEALSRGLKALAKEAGIAVVVLSQLNRQADGSEPELAHLKESGAIEEDADVVILLHPLATLDPAGGRTVLTKIAKNRQGRTGRLALRFEGTTQRWSQSSADVSREARR